MINAESTRTGHAFKNCEFLTKNIRESNFMFSLGKFRQQVKAGRFVRTWQACPRQGKYISRDFVSSLTNDNFRFTVYCTDYINISLLYSFYYFNRARILAYLGALMYTFTSRVRILVFSSSIAFAFRARYILHNLSTMQIEHSKRYYPAR